MCKCHLVSQASAPRPCVLPGCNDTQIGTQGLAGCVHAMSDVDKAFQALLVPNESVLVQFSPEAGRTLSKYIVVATCW